MIPRQFQTRRPVRFGETPTKQKLIGIPSGIDGVNVTLRYMSALVNAYKISPKIREFSLRLIAGLPQKDYAGEVAELFDYVKYHIRYVRDIYNVETVQSPEYTLEHAAGDCDDKSTLLATMLASLGFKTRFRAMGFTRSFCHVIVEALVNDKWVSLDATEPEELGWLPGNITMNMFHVNDENNLGFWAEALTAIKGAVSKDKQRKDEHKIADRQKAAERKQLLRDQSDALTVYEQKAADEKKKIIVAVGVGAVGLGLLWYFSKPKK